MNGESYKTRFLLRVSLVAAIAVCPLVMIVPAQAQDSSINQGAETDDELLINAEATLRVLASQFAAQKPRDIQSGRQAHGQLKRILERNPTTAWRQRVEEDLVQVQEILAYHNLQIARFYMDTRSHGGRKGAQSRLLEIARAYPRFSQMDEVLLRLSTLALGDERLDDAATHLWKLVCRYPTSSKRALAFERLDEVGYRSWHGCESFEQ